MARLPLDLRAVDRFAAGLRAAVVFFRPVVFLADAFFAVDLRLVAFFAGLRLAVLRLAGLRFAVRLAVVLFAVLRFAVLRLAVDLRAVDFFAVDVFLRADVFFADDFFLAGGIPHLLSDIRTPCASGVASPARSYPPTRRTARPGAARS